MKFAAYPKSYFQNLSRAALDQRAHVEAKGVFHKSKACRTGQFHNRCGICDRAPDAASDALVRIPSHDGSGLARRIARTALTRVYPWLSGIEVRGGAWLLLVTRRGLLCPSCGCV